MLKKLKPLHLVILLIVGLVLIYFHSQVSASTLEPSTLVELGDSNNSYAGPMTASDVQSFAFAFKAANNQGSGGTVSIAFPGSFTVSAAQVVTTTGCTTLTGAGNALPGAITAAGSGTTITISSVGALTAGQSYCAVLSDTTNNSITNPAAGVYNPVISTSGGDSQTVSVDVLSAGANSYTVSATVPAAFTMSLSSTTDAFTSSLSASSVTVTNGVTTTINTNAASGWFVWAKDTNAGLTSASAGHTIGSVATGSNFNFGGSTGNDEYGLGVSADNTANYAYTGSNHGGGLSNTTYNEIATSGSTASNVQFTTHELADLNATSPAGSDYSDTISEIGAGNF